ncbi:hypothetical protein [Streptomyces sp. NPDC048192]|jgi:hypothetical protein|uniref:hypothetical protein n=1 Tax=Streptomyces sp. NPDC048192 TaxID=3365510 RepID=UPI00371179EE
MAARGARAAERGRTRWGTVAAILALPALILGCLAVMAVRFATSDHPLGGAPEKVPCAEALAFGGARLPDGAFEGRCTVRTWLDTDYEAEFRLPRTELWSWLRRTYPQAPAPDTGFCVGGGADFCVDMDSAATVPPGIDANAVQIDVTYEGPRQALVRFSAFTV